MEFDIDHVKKAYLYLKSYAYHENFNLFLKQRVANFESGKKNIEQSFEDILQIINSDHPSDNENFKSWVDDIDYHILPKFVGRSDDYRQNEHNKEKGLFISNVRDSDKYQVSKINYFISAPVEIHIIDMLWCIFSGSALESEMSEDSYGNRMHPLTLSYVKNFEEKNTNELFKRYIRQYNKWRDQAIKIATEISKDGEDVALFSLDLKSYFYHVDLNFDKIDQVVRSSYKESREIEILSLKLNRLLDSIQLQYRILLSPKVLKTHINCKSKSGLPIGLVSSAIIANWYLSDFDVRIGDDVRPAYYGRYVDDILMVFKRPKFDINDPISSFVDNYLKGTLDVVDGQTEYVIYVDENSLPIQKDKLIFQFFDKEHSRAGLEVFKQELDERSSAFKFLPSDHLDRELERYAYDVLYDGSANKLRSIVGLAENETELAKYLSSHIMAHRLCKIDKNNTVEPQLKSFFKGQNALQFFRLWEKIYQYSIITKNYKFSVFFYQYIDSEISKIDGINPLLELADPEITEKIRFDLKKYNAISLSITLGLLDLKKYEDNDLSFFIEESFFLLAKPAIDRIIKNNNNLYYYSKEFRRSNLIRHHLVSWPVANFSNYNGDLTSEEDLISNPEINLDADKIEYSPRFINSDEFQLFNLVKYLDCENGLNGWIKDAINKYFDNSSSVSFEEEAISSSNIVKSFLRVDEKESKDSLVLAIANLVISESDISSALRKDDSPNISFRRQEKIYSILNSALLEKADILMMPEVAIPVSWLPFMVAFSRRHQLGLIFGLEHWVVKETAYNLIIEVLPFKETTKYKSCVVSARIKNHYAPSELELLASIRLKPGNVDFKENAFYHKVSWRGVSFATYNCFELSDITHRVLFKSEIDLLFACVWNKDTNYYQHILESAVRDLHCYTVQANTSQYGGSCVLRPTKTESKTMLYVKGGENSCVLATKLDIKSLREFQYKSKPGLKDYFKHLPPGYNSEFVIKR